MVVLYWLWECRVCRIRLGLRLLLCICVGNRLWGSGLVMKLVLLLVVF